MNGTIFLTAGTFFSFFFLLYFFYFFYGKKKKNFPLFLNNNAYVSSLWINDFVKIHFTARRYGVTLQSVIVFDTSELLKKREIHINLTHLFFTYIFVGMTEKAVTFYLDYEGNVFDMKIATKRKNDVSGGITVFLDSEKTFFCSCGEKKYHGIPHFSIHRIIDSLVKDKKLVGMARLELATPRSQSECATDCATSRL